MDASLLQKLWPVFSEESREHLQEIGAGILEMERGNANNDLLNGIKRTAHGLKGSAASLGLEDLEKLAHAVETAIANQKERDKLESSLVEAILAAVNAAEAALEKGDAGEFPSVEDLAAHLAALTNDDTKVISPGLLQLWQVFQQEAGQQVLEIRKGLKVFSQRGSPSWLDEDQVLSQLGESLQSLASMVGFSELEKLVAFLKDELIQANHEKLMSPARLQVVQSCLTELERAIKSDRPPSGPFLPLQSPSTNPEKVVARSVSADSGNFIQESSSFLTKLEDSTIKLCSPCSVEQRKAEIEKGAEQAKKLAEIAHQAGNKPIADLSLNIGNLLLEMAEPGLKSSKNAAAIADQLISIQKLLGNSQTSSASMSISSSDKLPSLEDSSPSGKTPGITNYNIHARSIRVSINTLESLARQIENTAITFARQERRAKELQNQVQISQSIRLLCEEILAELRHAEFQGPLSNIETALHRLRLHERRLGHLAQEAHRESEHVRLLSTVMRDDLRDLRMVPASLALDPLRRTVRDVAGRLKKNVNLVLKGADVRLDRRILDELKDPLLHLVRNAIDHGIESPEKRKQTGKQETGVLEVSVERRGHRIMVIVRDDGGGLISNKIRDVAVERGLLSQKEAYKLSDDDALRLVFQPGFSTAGAVTTISGRGVGLDVVASAVHKLRGTVDVSTKESKGTSFELDLPLTLAATLAVVVKIGNNITAIPYESVERILRLSAQDLGTVANKTVVLINQEQVPYSSMAQVLGLSSDRVLSSEKPQPALLIKLGEQRIVFAVDEIVGQYEVVVQSLGKRLTQYPLLAGTAVLDSSEVVSVLNPAELIRLAKPLVQKKIDDSRHSRILVVDDSLTTRSAMKAVLEIAGYQVVPAADGEEALNLLKRTPFDLVVTDVQMPRMDGLTLTRQVKSDPAITNVPVIVVTSLDTNSDRAAGLEAGADGYLVKKDVERGKLLDLVRQLIPS